MSTPPADVEPRRSGDAACLERSEACRSAGDRRSAWLADAEPVIGQAERRQIAALAAELSGRRVRARGGTCANAARGCAMR